jgi:hypothetical protein
MIMSKMKSDSRFEVGSHVCTSCQVVIFALAAPPVPRLTRRPPEARAIRVGFAVPKLISRHLQQ